MSAGFAANVLSVSVTFAESFPGMFRVLMLSLNKDQKRFEWTIPQLAKLLNLKTILAQLERAS